MISYSKKIIRNWKKSPSEIITNSLDGKDQRTGERVRVLMISVYTPVIIAGYLDQLDGLVQQEGATLRKTIRYTESKVKFSNSVKNKLARLNTNINAATEKDPARPEEIAARDTILALRDSALYNRNKLLDVTTFITISARKKHQLDAAEASLKTWFDDMGGELDSLLKEQLEAMRQTSPAFDSESKRSKFFNNKHYGRATTDSVAARTYPMTRGTFSEGQGMYMGRRTEDGGFCFINLCDPDNPKAQNITVFGKTGEGKSYFLKALVVSLLEEGIRCFVFDLDGEWYDLCQEVGGVYVDHTSEEGRYFEPLTIMPAIPEIDEECRRFNSSRWKNAVNNGVRTFSLLADDLLRAEVYEIGEAIKTVFDKAGIEQFKQETWQEPFSGPRPTIHLVFKEIANRAKSSVHAENLYDKVKIYFDGIYNDLFRTEESLEFNDAPLIVYKVGSGEKDDAKKDERAKQAQIKMSMAFDTVNSNIQRLRFEGEYFSAVLVDEGQRQMQNPELRTAIFDWYTSIRKWNGMMILASNTPAIMLDTAEGVGMWENTNIRVYFFMEQSAVRTLSNFSEVPVEIQQNISQNEGSNQYILEYHKKYDELFMDVPEAESRLYKTRGLKNKAS
jgi:hypothetical protein